VCCQTPASYGDVGLSPQSSCLRPYAVTSGSANKMTEHAVHAWRCECRGWLSAAAVRGSVLWAPSKTLGLRRAWAVGKKGELEPAGARGKAHRDRVTALAAAGGFLYSVSYDGTVKMWDAASLELVMEERGAHAGGRLHCAAAAADGHLYTGGDDKARPAARALCLQRWHRPPPLCLRRQHRPPPS